ncbi:PREDICTED: calcineurin subunit B-like [Lupinus angustifolius]|uniref:calcineurin subunit B-like n=1 Tax=Lupinus angustifolius TaxID=3871 RepID=UPI00092F3FD0|nr:PREDICTED: calcineurin subunit B-like [Lupinus angustifolius]
MRNTSSMLTQYDIEEVQDHCKHAFTQQEIVSLYQRFCQLDRNKCGFISSDEFTVFYLVQEVLTQVLEEAGYNKDSFLVLSDFMKILSNSGLKMEAEIPVD